MYKNNVKNKKYILLILIFYKFQQISYSPNNTRFDILILLEIINILKKNLKKATLKLFKYEKKCNKKNILYLKERHSIFFFLFFNMVILILIFFSLL